MFVQHVLKALLQ